MRERSDVAVALASGISALEGGVRVLLGTGQVDFVQVVATQVCSKRPWDFQPENTDDWTPGTLLGLNCCTHRLNVYNETRGRWFKFGDNREGGDKLQVYMTIERGDRPRCQKVCHVLLGPLQHIIEQVFNR